MSGSQLLYNTPEVGAQFGTMLATNRCPPSYLRKKPSKNNVLTKVWFAASGPYLIVESDRSRAPECRLLAQRYTVVIYFATVGPHFWPACVRLIFCDDHTTNQTNAAGTTPGCPALCHGNIAATLAVAIPRCPFSTQSRFVCPATLSLRQPLPGAN